jgi:hypothetical protein
MTKQQLIDEGYTDGKKSFEYLWQQIEENFQWQKVYDTMKMLDWHWHIHDEKYGIPRVDTIRKEARRLCFNAYEQGKGSTSTGGFTASFFDNILSLAFVVEDWAADN